jgi:hypothetical protein
VSAATAAVATASHVLVSAGGFYTPDYSAYAGALRINLDSIGAPHDLQAAPACQFMRRTDERDRSLPILFRRQLGLRGRSARRRDLSRSTAHGPA